MAQEIDEVFPAESRVRFRRSDNIETTGTVVSCESGIYKINWMGNIQDVPSSRVIGPVQGQNDYYLRQAQESNRLEHEDRAHRESREDW